jgi:hypothetical protein
VADGRTLEFGVNLNNREPLIAPDYDIQMLLALSEKVEELGFDSVWVGDSLLPKPCYEAVHDHRAPPTVGAHGPVAAGRRLRTVIVRRSMLWTVLTVNTIM